MDPRDFRGCRISDLYKPMADQACAILCRIGDYLIGDPILLLLAQEKHDLFPLSRHRNIGAAVALSHNR